MFTSLCSHFFLINSKYSNSSRNILRVKLLPNVIRYQERDMTTLYPKQELSVSSSLSATLTMQITPRKHTCNLTSDTYTTGLKQGSSNNMEIIRKN